jgi:hypothetical protein
MAGLHGPDPGVDRHARSDIGLCATPLSWDEVQAIVADGSLTSMRVLGRSRGMLQSYLEFKSRIDRLYVSMVDRIMIEVFKCEWKVNEDQKVEHVPRPSGSTSNSGPFFVQNDFPYHLQPGIEHYLLWSDRIMLDEEVEEYLRSDPVARQSSSWLAFVNPTELQSIPEIHHVHVLLKVV